MFAKKIYGKTEIGSVGTMTYGGMVAVGVPADDTGYEGFAVFVAELEAMERQGLIRIESKHQESQRW